MKIKHETDIKSSAHISDTMLLQGKEFEIKESLQEISDEEIPELIPHDDPLLHQKVEHFDFNNPPMDPVYLAKLLLKTMYKHNGIGLSANQVGLPYRAFAMRGNPAIGVPNYVCFNPRLASEWGDMQNFKEGCLTYPGLGVKIKRCSQIRVRFNSPYGEHITKTFVGLTARIFQHEYDHMEGIDFISRATKLNREKAKKDWKILQRRMK